MTDENIDIEKRFVKDYKKLLDYLKESGSVYTCEGVNVSNAFDCGYDRTAVITLRANAKYSHTK